MNIEDLLILPQRPSFAAVPEADAVRESGALQEAQLLAVRVDALRSQAWLLFDCRGALQIEGGNTAVVAVSGLRTISWEGEPRGPRTAWSVVGWEPDLDSGRWSVAVAFAPRARLSLEAAFAAVYVGDVPGCDAAPPDYTEADERTLQAGIAHWSSEFHLVYATFSDR